MIFFEGEIQEIKSTEEKGKKVTRFYVIGHNQSAGGIMSFEIFETNSGVCIHYFKKLDGFSKYFYGHRSSDDETQAIIDYWLNYQAQK